MKTKRTKTNRKKDTSNTTADHPLAADLVARGLVADGRQGDLTEFLLARDRFLGFFTKHSDLPQKLAEFQHGTKGLVEHARQVQWSIQQHLEFLACEVQSTLDVILAQHPEMLQRFQGRQAQLAQAAEFGQAFADCADRAEHAARAYDDVQELLQQVREGLQPAASAPARR